MSLPKVTDVHPFLYHYTDFAGLNGILKTNELWATHIRFLNDQTEYLHAQRYVESFLVPDIKNWLEQTTNTDLDIQKIVEELGGIEHQSLDLAKSAMQSMYTVTGDDFFVVSFCGTPPHEYEKLNGLLSQWRGYGNQQGFILVFETKSLGSMMQQEADQFSNDVIYLADVVYSDDEESIKREFSKDLQQLRDFVVGMNEAIAKKADPPAGTSALISFINLATRFKHRAFAEEKEVRMVGAVVKHTTKLKNIATQQNVTLHPEKPIELRPGKSGLTPYIKFFGADRMKLPICRIIVGPGRDKHAVAAALRKGLRGHNIEIAVSEIPFV